MNILKSISLASLAIFAMTSSVQASDLVKAEAVNNSDIAQLVQVEVEVSLKEMTIETESAQESAKTFLAKQTQDSKKTKHLSARVIAD
jgi:hypothetical protein